jgi:hypothetical protein
MKVTTRACNNFVASQLVNPNLRSDLPTVTEQPKKLYRNGPTPHTTLTRWVTQDNT